MRYNNVCIVKLNHHFIALGLRRIVSKSPNGEKGYMYVHIKHVIFQGRTSGLKSTSATSGLQDFLIKVRPKCAPTFGAGKYNNQCNGTGHSSTGLMAALVYLYCMGLVTYRSEICRKEKLLVKSRPSSSSLNWSAAVHVSSLKGLAKA